MLLNSSPKFGKALRKKGKHEPNDGISERAKPLLPRRTFYFVLTDNDRLRGTWRKTSGHQQLRLPWGAQDSSAVVLDTRLSTPGSEEGLSRPWMLLQTKPDRGGLRD